MMPNSSSYQSLGSQKSKTKSRASKRQRNRRKSKKKCPYLQNKVQAPPPTPNPESASTTGWHAQHQENYWRQLALKLQSENEKLKKDLAKAYSYTEGGLREKVSRTDAFEVQNTKRLIDDIDIGYLEFLDTTLQHQEEIRMLRNLECLD